MGGERRVPIFFYGAYMNAAVLGRQGFDAPQLEACTLDGFDIAIERLATLAPSENSTVYGALAHATHAELRGLYGQEWLGSYVPEPVVVRDRSGNLRIALCFFSPRAPERPAADYLDWIVDAARELGFPDWYVAKLEAWR